jgi:hypothetical protein
VTTFSFNGVEMTEEEFRKALDESQEYMRGEERRIQEEYGVTLNTASAIMYLRGRSRWTLEKELELIERDHAKNPISLGTVLSGEF